jgi:hypothetical protein
MKLNRDQSVAGVDILKSRNVFRKFARGNLSHVAIMKELSITERKANKLIGDLLTLELICPCETRQDKATRYYETTINGNALGFAKASKPVWRATAERVLGEFLDRASAVNGNRELAYRVESVIVFGSYLSAAKRLNDLDIAVELVPNWNDNATLKSVCKASTNRACATGRRFRDFFEQMAWPPTEVMLILKNRSRTITFCEWESLCEMEELRYCVPIGNKKRIAALIEHGRPIEWVTDPRCPARG